MSKDEKWKEEMRGRAAVERRGNKRVCVIFLSEFYDS